jgi:hypothetical protein
MVNPPNGMKQLIAKEFVLNPTNPQLYDVFQTKAMQGPSVRNYIMTEFYFNKAG